jgi:hypothetical protein
MAKWIHEGFRLERRRYYEERRERRAARRRAREFEEEERRARELRQYAEAAAAAREYTARGAYRVARAYELGDYRGEREERRAGQLAAADYARREREREREQQAEARRVQAERAHEEERWEEEFARVYREYELSLWQSKVDNDFWVKFFSNSQQLRKTSSGTSVAERSLYFALLRQWLVECDKSHLCKPKKTFWPTRIIFVGDSDSTELQLWETESRKAQLSGVDGYFALSHRWGFPTKTEKEQFCTTRENYRRRLEGFSIDDLPKTFKDAVQVTRALGKRYLWIDALCIIQAIEGADGSDWEIEASRMEQVFGYAYCTIAASSAEDWTKGFLEWNSTPRSVQDVLDALKRWKSTPRFAQYALGRWKPARFIQDALGSWKNTAGFTKDVDAARLNQRAWVLQERVLSRRTIHFTESHTYWECGVHVRCGNFTKLKM